MNKSTKLLECKRPKELWTKAKTDSAVADPTQDFEVSIPSPTSHKLDDSVAVEAVELLKICSNPTPAQAVPPRPPADPCAAVVWTKQREKVRAHAYKLWEDKVSESMSKDWLRQVHKDAVAAGIRKEAFNPSSRLASFRMSHEDDWDIRGLDYALDSETGLPSEKLKWLPMPAHAADPEWVRLGVNLFRSGIGRRLITKEEWPPKPTTLMMEKGADK